MLNSRVIINKQYNYSVILFVTGLFVVFYSTYYYSFADSIKGSCPNGYALSDWLLNYQGGFIRRGLAGELIRNISNQTFLYPAVNLLVFILGLIVTFTLFILFIYRSMSLRVKTAAVFALNPAGIPLIFAGVFYRKEMLFHVITIAHLLIITIIMHTRRFGGIYSPVVFGFFTVFGTMVALTHESYLFICFACNFAMSLYFYNSNLEDVGNKHGFQKAFLIQAVPLLACIFAFVFNGNPSVGQSIWDSIDILDKLQIYSFLPHKINNLSLAKVGTDWDHAMNSIAPTAEQIISVQLNMFMTGEIFLWVLIIMISSCYLVEASVEYLLDVNVYPGLTERGDAIQHEEAIRNGACSLLYYLVLCSFPLYLITIDYGRWICSIFILYMLVIFFQPNMTIFMFDIARKNHIFNHLTILICSYHNVVKKYLWPGQNSNLAKSMLLIYWLTFVNVSHYCQMLGDMISGFIPHTLQNNQFIHDLVVKLIS